MWFGVLVVFVVQAGMSSPKVQWRRHSDTMAATWHDGVFHHRGSDCHYMTSPCLVYPFAVPDVLPGCVAALQVYVLSRMGNSAAALRLIIRNQQDIPRAIEFVRLQQDEELWEELIDWALSSADTTGG